MAWATMALESTDGVPVYVLRQSPRNDSEAQSTLAYYTYYHGLADSPSRNAHRTGHESRVM